MKKIKLSVPTSLEDITLGQYQRYLKIVDKNEGEEYNDFTNKKLIEIFCDVSLADVESIPVLEFNKVLEIINKAFAEKHNLTRHFTLGDHEMGFIPNLEEMSLGEYVDLESTISDWENMHKAMAVLYRPVNFKSKERYTISPYKPNDELREWMKQMPLSVTMGAVVFFYDLGIELSKASLVYLEKELRKAPKTSQLHQALEKNGDGINLFMDSLKETLQNLTKLPKNHYLSV